MRLRFSRSIRARRLGGITAFVAVLLVATSAQAATWTVSRTPNDTPFDNVLWGVDALSPNRAWAVGHADTGMAPTRQPVVQRWNGTSWRSTANSRPVGGGELRDVDAISSRSAWAVGFSNSDVGFDTLIERWNGRRWRIVASPNVSAQNTLLGVKAFSASDAWAVGSHNVPGTLNFATLVERWDGKSWEIVPSPSPAPFENRLSDIDGVSSTDLWAVGVSQNSEDGVRQSLIMHFDGSTWTSVAAPPANDASLEGVVALASDDVWAVGWKFSISLFWHVPYALHWDGSSWTEIPMPTSSPQGGRLFGVTGASPTKVYAVGHSNAGGGVPPLIMRWNGSAWKVETTPSPSTVSYLWDASAALPSTALAVGNRQQLSGGNLQPSRTLALHTGNA